MSDDTDDAFRAAAERHRAMLAAGAADLTPRTIANQILAAVADLEGTGLIRRDQTVAAMEIALADLQRLKPGFANADGPSAA